MQDFPSGSHPMQGPCANELGTADGPFAAGLDKVSVVKRAIA